MSLPWELPAVCEENQLTRRGSLSRLSTMTYIKNQLASVQNQSQPMASLAVPTVAPTEHPMCLVFFEMPSEGNVQKNRSALADQLTRSLKSRLKLSLQVLEGIESVDDLVELLHADAAVHGLVIDWTLSADHQNPSACRDTEHNMLSVLSRVHLNDFLSKMYKWKPKLPVVLLVERGRRLGGIVEHVSECLFLFEDTTEHIAGRVIDRVTRYMETIVPPFTTALFKYSKIHEFSFAAPGHQGGTAFRKTTTGRMLYDFFDENLFRSDMGIERTELGSLLQHTGPIGDSERCAARIFGAHASYSGVVGTSGSNRTLFTACLNERDIAVCDRNCHKSIEQGLIISGATPVYLVPSRNRYGVIGPIFEHHITPEAIQQSIQDSALAKKAYDDGCLPVYSVITNCTYDGVCYDAVRVREQLSATQSMDFVHFDEAWFAYARFHPMYARRFAMNGSPAAHDKSGPTVFATQSTHKLLAALSQASYIHVRHGRNPVQPSMFNEAYMMHTTTSPLYAIVASNDVAAAVMEHDGTRLVSDTIKEAVLFRQQLAVVNRDAKRQGSWFFSPWNAERVQDPATGLEYDFEDAPLDLLCTEPRCWQLAPGQTWHGFDGITEGYAMLDPIKIGIITPGLAPDGSMLPEGIPAALLSAYLSQNGIVVARTLDHQVLVMFSIGVTRGKWSTLLSVLYSFKKAWDGNTQLSKALRKRYQANKLAYRDRSLQDLGKDMWDYMHSSNTRNLLNDGFSVLPHAVMTPRQAQQRTKREARSVPLEEAAGKVAAAAIIPYPPGIPLVMTGESLGPLEGPYLQYLLAMQAWDQKFPGFENEIEGIEIQDGRYRILILD